MFAAKWKRCLAALSVESKRHRRRRRQARTMQIELLETRQLLAAGDFLFVGEELNDSVRQFAADTGEFAGNFVAPGSAGLHGPRGLLFHQGNLLVVNQNVDQPFAGAVLRFDGKTGAALSPLVAETNPNAPFAPRGTVVHNNVLYVADSWSPGNIARYNAATGGFLGKLAPTGFNDAFQPRGVVVGPDGGLYVSAFNENTALSNDPAGYVFRFDIATGSSRVIAANNGDGTLQPGEATGLHNPEGLVFGPEGRIYVISSRTGENGHILVIDPSVGTVLESIELTPNRPGEPTRANAQALLFGPGQLLYLPVRLTSQNTGLVVDGAVWTYDPAAKSFDRDWATTSDPPPVALPWYLTFGKTDPATLAYPANPVNAPPVLAGIEPSILAYEANSGAVAITATLTVSDRDSSALNSATVSIGADYRIGEDLLRFANTAKITGTWNAATGVLTLGGTASLADYQAALRNVRYENLTGETLAGLRSVNFQIHDGLALSNLVTRQIAGTPSTTIPVYIYVGDQGAPDDPSDDRIVQLDAATGVVIRTLSVPGRLIGPTGLIFENPDSLLVVNQNVEQPIPGEILRFDRKTGRFLGAVVAATLPGGAANPAAPFSPRGAVVRDNTLYVADFAQGDPTGRISKYSLATGKHLGDLVPVGFAAPFRPRGIAFGPDGQLYVSSFGLGPADEFNPLAGYVLRIDPKTGNFAVVAGNDGDGVHEPGEIAGLHRPEGLVIHEATGVLYVTSYRANINDTDKILAIDPATSTLLDTIELGPAGNPRSYAAALVFGPGGLYVPISGDGPSSGSIRKYNLASKTFSEIVRSAQAGGPLISPWYLTFGNSRQDTLAYDPPSPWHNSVNPLDVNGRDGVTPIDALVLINYLNEHGNGLPGAPAAGPPYYAVNVTGGTHNVSSNHVLRIINYLNQRALGSAALLSQVASERLASVTPPSRLSAGVPGPSATPLARTELARTELARTELAHFPPLPETASFDSPWQLAAAVDTASRNVEPDVVRFSNLLDEEWDLLLQNLAIDQLP